MAPDEDSAKAEKLAAAKKRLEQLKKKKAGQAVKAASIGVVDSPAARETPDLSVLSAAQGPTLLPDSQTVETAFTPSLESQKQPDRSWFAEEPVKVSIVPDAVPISKERSVEHATVDPLTILQQDIEQKALQIEGLQGKVNDLEARIISLQAGKVTDSDDDITKVSNISNVS